VATVIVTGGGGQIVSIAGSHCQAISLKMVTRRDDRDRDQQHGRTEQPDAAQETAESGDRGAPAAEGSAAGFVSLCQTAKDASDPSDMFEIDIMRPKPSACHPLA